MSSFLFKALLIAFSSAVTGKYPDGMSVRSLGSSPKRVLILGFLNVGCCFDFICIGETGHCGCDSLRMLDHLSVVIGREIHGRQGVSIVEDLYQNSI